MTNPILSRWTIFVVAGILAALAPKLLRKRAAIRRATLAAMALVAMWGAWAHTDFGAFHGSRGNVHVHDFYHYYVGPKYIPELGYYGLYAGTVEALSETTNGSAQPKRMRDLREGSRFFDSVEEIAAQRATYRARFSPERWQAFRSDIAFLYGRVPESGFWEKVVLDAGFNPPPTFALLSHAVANRVPLTSRTLPILSSIDLGLLLVAGAIVLWAFGPTAAMLFFVVLGNAPVRTYTWTGGSFFRHAWLFALICGIALLARRKWKGGGAALGISASFVFFPFVFVAGALVPLVHRAWVGKVPSRFWAFVLGLGVSLVFVGGASLLVFGASPWTEWLARISSHDASFFTNHIGLKKVTTYVPEAAGQNFGVGNTLFSEWNHALAERGARTRLFDRGLQVALTAALAWWMRRSKPHVAAVILGAALLIVWTTPASYYTTFCAMLAVVTVGRTWRNPFHAARFALVMGFFFGAKWLNVHQPDAIVHSAALSALWIVAVALMALCSAFEHDRIETLREELRRRGVRFAGVIVAGLTVLGVAFATRYAKARPEQLPTAEGRGGTASDYVHFGEAASQQSHALSGSGSLSGPFAIAARRYMDPYGDRISDSCLMLKFDNDVNYIMIKKGSGPARLVIRTDSFYAGDLTVEVNGAPIPGARLEPRQTMFGYVSVSLPALPAGPLRIRHTTTAKDVGLFTGWLVEDEPRGR